MKASQGLVSVLKILGEIAENSSLDLCLVGGIPRNIVYKILYDKDGRLVQRQDGRVAERKDHEDEENAEIGVPLYAREILKQLSESELGYDVDLVINSSAALWLKSIENIFWEKTGKRIQIIEEFKAFQTVKVMVEGLEDYSFEFASARTESYSHAASFPEVELCTSLALDVPRRDFTINAFLISLKPTNFLELIDYSSALSDMENGLVRVFHSQSFIDDPTRIYRAFRFALEYGFELEKNTEEYLKAALKNENFPIWFKKRKNRFLIELEKYRKFIPLSFD